MVKGTSRQVIMVHAPDPQMFEQAIFILKEGAPGVGYTEDALIKEAQRVIKDSGREGKKRYFLLYGAVWACAGALITGIIWGITAFLL